MPIPRRANPSTKAGQANNDLVRQGRIEGFSITPGVLRDRTTRGTFARPQAQFLGGGSKGAIDVGLFKVGSLHDTYLVCREVLGYDADNLPELATGDTYIAKPPKIRDGDTGNSNFRSTTYPTLGGSVDPVTIVENLFPVYEENADQIIAVKLDAGTNLFDDQNRRIEWEDVNVDARTWLLPKTIVNVCILVGGINTTKKMQIYGSNPF